MTDDEAKGRLRWAHRFAEYLAAQGYQAALTPFLERCLDQYMQVAEAYSDNAVAFDLLCQRAGLRPSDIGVLSGAASWRRVQQEGRKDDA